MKWIMRSPTDIKVFYWGQNRLYKLIEWRKKLLYKESRIRMTSNLSAVLLAAIRQLKHSKF